MMRSRLLPLAVAVLAPACGAPPARVPAPQPAPVLSTVPLPSAAPETTTIVIAATTDVHGRLRGWDYYENRADSARGLTRAATIVDSVRRAHRDRVVLLDAGDLLQGNPLTYVAARVSTDTMHPVVAAMNAMQYDAAAIGNHEFNYGLPLLDRAIRQARFPFLAANGRRLDGGRPFPSFTIVERAGVRVGIVGATTPGSLVWDRANLAGRVDVSDVVPAVRTAVDSARAAGAQVVVVTIHSGLDGPSSYDTVTTGVASENVTARLAREVAGIDAIVFGHSHREVADTVINGVLLMQPKNWATSVVVGRLSLQRDAGSTWRVVARSGRLVRAARWTENPEVVAAVDLAHRETVAYTSAVIGTTPVAWRADSARVADVALIDFIGEVQRRTAGADLAATAAFSLTASLDAGPITVADVAQLYPYENTLRSVRVTGEQVRAFLEHSARYYREWSAQGGAVVDPSVPGYNFDVLTGVDYTLDISRPVGQRVTRLDFRGRPVRDAQTFTLALNNYRQGGGGGFAMLRDAPVVYTGDVEIRQLLIDEVRRRGTLRPADYFRRNWRLVPAAAAAAAYAEQRGGAAESQGGAALRAPRSPLRIISTNDFHGALEARPDGARGLRGGAGAMAAVIARARAECVVPCQSVLLDGGDMFQGTPASNLAFGRPVVELFNRLGYAAGALGNHEFDWGQDTLRARMRGARYGILGANVRYADGRDVPWIRDDTLIRRGPLRIGVIGIATVETPRVTRARNVSDLRFADPAPIVSARARALRARGADYVIVVAHAGGFCNEAADGSGPSCSGEIFDFARRLTEPVDAIVSGHSHSAVTTRVNNIPIVQARSRGQAVGVIDLGRDAQRLPEVRAVITDSITIEPMADSLARAATTAVAPRMSVPIAQVAEDLRRTGTQYALGNLVADAQRRAGGGDVAIMNNGGIRADLRAGPATYGSLFEVQPFANILYRVTVRGRDLRAYAERLVRTRPNVHISGMTIEYDSTRAPGSRITRLEVGAEGGGPVSDTATYTVIMNDFLVTGGDGLGLSQVALETRNLNIIDLDALLTYMRALPAPIRAPAARRITAVAVP